MTILLVNNTNSKNYWKEQNPAEKERPIKRSLRRAINALAGAREALLTKEISYKAQGWLEEIEECLEKLDPIYEKIS